MRLTPAGGSLARLVAGGLVAGTLATGTVLGGGAGAAYAVDGDDCASIDGVDTVGEQEVTEIAGEGSPIDALQIEAAQERVRELSDETAGEGVVVAVLDSGVRAQPGLTVLPEQAGPAPVYHQGTLLAGVIAADPDPETGAPVGIAPGATIVDQRVYDTDADSDDGLARPSSEALAAGLRAIEPAVGPRGIQIVTVGLDVEDTPELRAAVDAVTGKGAILVAASGARGESGEESTTAFENGEDAAADVFPAGYATDLGDRPANPRVVSVTTTGDVGDGSGEIALEDVILFSSAIDVAAPSGGLVSLAVNDGYCAVYDPSPAAASAVVSGVLALLRTAFPDDTPDQLVTRLETTASGVATVDPAVPNTRIGKGVVQPLEALTRPLAPDADGVLPRSTLPEQPATPAVLPVPDPDVLASTRDNAVWWGLLGGGTLAVLVLLRPVLARRRRTP